MAIADIQIIRDSLAARAITSNTAATRNAVTAFRTQLEAEDATLRSIHVGRAVEGLRQAVVRLQSGQPAQARALRDIVVNSLDNLLLGR